MESRVVELERLAQSFNQKIQNLGTALTHVVLYLNERAQFSGEMGYSPRTSRPPGAVPPLGSAIPPKPGFVSEQAKDVPTITQRDVNMLVPAVHELQQLYLEMARHFQVENLEGRVGQLEQDYKGMEDVPDDFDTFGDRLQALEEKVTTLLAGSIYATGELSEAGGKRLHILEETVKRGHESGHEMMAELGRQLGGFASAFRTLEDKVTALDNVVVHHTVDPMVANWDRHEILDVLRHLHEQMEGVLDFQGKVEFALQQQDLLNAHFANENKKMKHWGAQLRDSVAQILSDFAMVLLRL